MWNFGVTLVFCVLIGVSTAIGIFDTLGFGVQVPNLWLDYEDVDDYSGYDYKEYEDTEYYDTESSQYNDTDADNWEFNNTDGWQYNETHKWRYNDSDEWQYNETDNWLYNETDYWQYNETDNWQYNETDNWQFNETENWQFNETENWQFKETDNWQYNSTDEWQNHDTKIHEINEFLHDNHTRKRWKDQNITRIQPPPVVYHTRPSVFLPPFSTHHQRVSMDHVFLPRPVYITRPSMVPPTSSTHRRRVSVDHVSSGHHILLAGSGHASHEHSVPSKSSSVSSGSVYNQSSIPYYTQGEEISYTSLPSALGGFGGLIGWRKHYHEDDDDKCPYNETCLKKCCPIGKGYDLSKDVCSAISEDFNPPVWKTSLLIEFHILRGRIDCLPSSKEDRKLATSITPDFHLQPDGTLLVESYRVAGPELVYNTSKYCIDLFITPENKTEWNAFICYVTYDFEKHFVLTGSCMLITCFLVLMRVMVFAWLPELRTLHGMILMAYLVSFLVGFLLLGSKMLLMYEHNINEEMCVVSSFIVYFSILSAFFWRNIMCYDIWRTFSGKRAISSRGSASRTRLYLYCAYAFGGPTGLTVLLTVLEYSNLPEEHSLMPKIRRHGCNSLYGYSKLLYFYGPIIILFAVNMILFTLTALKIAASKKETKKILRSRESCTHVKQDKRRFTLYVKLFAAMVFLEVNWILEIITIFYPDAEIVLQITDLYNVVMLLVIFVNFLSQKQTWRMLKKRYNQIRGRPTSGLLTVVSTSRTLTSQISRISQVSQSQDFTITTDYRREEPNPADVLDCTQLTDCSRDMTNPAEYQNDNQVTDYSVEKANLSIAQDDAQLTVNSREITNPAEYQIDSQPTDCGPEKANLSIAQNDAQSTDYSREMTNPEVQG